MNIIMYNWEQQKIYIVPLLMVVKQLLYSKWTSAHDIQWMLVSISCLKCNLPLKHFKHYWNIVTLVQHSEFKQTAQKCNKTSFMSCDKQKKLNYRIMIVQTLLSNKVSPYLLWEWNSISNHKTHCFAWRRNAGGYYIQLNCN